MDDRDAMLCFVVAEFVVGIDKHRYHGDQRFKPATKTAYSTSQDRDVVPQIGVDPLPGIANETKIKRVSIGSLLPKMLVSSSKGFNRLCND
ncbi:MAG: hypothetical protein FWC27_11020 [Firmicutes bacterium]|nr:hypothetical protein [Bacillota bacterium]